MRQWHEDKFSESDLYYDENIDAYHIDELVDEVQQFEDEFVGNSSTKRKLSNTRKSLDDYMERKRLEQSLYDPFEDDFLDDR